jgi:hypothetical protein
MVFRDQELGKQKSFCGVSTRCAFHGTLTAMGGKTCAIGPVDECFKVIGHFGMISRYPIFPKKSPPARKSELPAGTYSN